MAHVLKRGDILKSYIYSIEEKYERVGIIITCYLIFRDNWEAEKCHLH